jgi:hypothetical protein
VLPAAENSAANKKKGCNYASGQTTLLANFGQIFFKNVPAFILQREI